MSSSTEKKPKYTRFKGDEGRRIFGRVRYLHEEGFSNDQIAEALTREGIERLPNGFPVTRQWVAPMITRWKQRPYRKLKYAPVTEPLNTDNPHSFDPYAEVKRLRAELEALKNSRGEF